MAALLVGKGWASGLRSSANGDDRALVGGEGRRECRHTGRQAGEQAGGPAGVRAVGKWVEIVPIVDRTS